MSNLQLFTEPGGDGGGSGEGNGAGAGADPENNGNTTMSFDDFLKLEGNQSEFDRRVQKAVNTAVTNAQTKWKTLTDDKVSEAEKLAQMTNEEKANYRAKKAEDALKEMQRGTVSGILADIKNICRSIEHTAHYAWNIQRNSRFLWEFWKWDINLVRR